MSVETQNPGLPDRSEAAASPDDPFAVFEQGNLPSRTDFQRFRRRRQAALRGAGQPELLEGGADLKIRLSFDKDAKTVTLEDNGIGMSREDVIAHLGTIAKSGTADFLKNLSGDQKRIRT